METLDQARDLGLINYELKQNIIRVVGEAQRMGFRIDSINIFLKPVIEYGINKKINMVNKIETKASLI